MRQRPSTSQRLILKVSSSRSITVRSCSVSAAISGFSTINRSNSAARVASSSLSIYALTLLKELEDVNLPRDQAEVLLRVIQQSQALDRLVSKETFDHRSDRLETKFDALPSEVMVDVLQWLLPLNLANVIGVLGLTGKAIGLF